MGAVISITGSFAWAFIAYTLCEVIVLLVLLVPCSRRFTEQRCGDRARTLT